MLSSLPSETPFCQTAFDPALYQEFPLIALFSFAGPLLIDVVVFDRQYSPFIFHYEGQTIIPAESVYAVFEAKQTIDAAQVVYAQQKVASVRRLHRTSLPIPYAQGTYPPKPLIPIYGGLLTFESEWNPPLAQPLREALHNGPVNGRLEVAPFV